MNRYTKGTRQTAMEKSKNSYIQRNTEGNSYVCSPPEWFVVRLGTPLMKVNQNKNLTKLGKKSRYIWVRGSDFLFDKINQNSNSIEKLKKGLCYFHRR